VQPVESASCDAHLYAPPWSILCLRAYVLERTRHTCIFLDCRQYTHLEKEFIEAVKTVPSPRLLVVNATTENIGQASAILEMAKRHFPETRTVLFGSYPSAFPDHAVNLPWADYALAGDPEPILRNLLDYMDVERRLQRVPGLVIPRVQSATPYWLTDLKSLSMPDWHGLFWSAYQVGANRGTCRAEMKLSRGHSHCPSDRIFGGMDEPLRTWPLDRAAMTLLKCAHLGVTEVFLTDPPGIWTVERLSQWCKALRMVRNSQPWGLRLLPTFIDDETLADMEFTMCRRVEFVYPSCDPDILKQYGCTIEPAHLAAMMTVMKEYNIQTVVRFLVGGPEESKPEELRIQQTIASLNYCRYVMQSMPLVFDAPLYRAFGSQPGTPRPDEWLQWTIHPWIEEKPVCLWGGKEALSRIEDIMQDAHSAIQHSWKRIFRGLFSRVLTTNWILAAEDRAVGLLPSALPHPDE